MYKTATIMTIIICYLAASATSFTSPVDQTVNGGQWNVIGTFFFSPESTAYLELSNGNTNGYVIADAVKFEKDGQEIIMDNNDTTAVTVTGTWLASHNTPGYYGTDYIHDQNELKGTKSVRFTPVLPDTGLYQVSLRWSASSNRATNVPVTVVSGTVTATQPGDDSTAATDTTHASLRFMAALAAGQPQKIVVYGTSLTDKGAWPGQVRDSLLARFPELVSLVNSGGSGQWSEWGLANVMTKVVAYDPDAVFIEFATNDAVDRFACTPALARANLEAIIDSILTANPLCDIVLMTMNPTTGGSPRPGLNDFFQVYRDVAAERGFALVDNYIPWSALLAADPARFASYVPDGVHPNVSGDSAIVTPSILSVLYGATPPADTDSTSDTTGTTGVASPVPPPVSLQAPGTIYTLQGRRVPLTGPAVPPGVYFVPVMADGEMTIRRIVPTR